MRSVLFNLKFTMKILYIQIFFCSYQILPIIFCATVSFPFWLFVSEPDFPRSGFPVVNFTMNSFKHCSLIFIIFMN